MLLYKEMMYCAQQKQPDVLQDLPESFVHHMLNNQEKYALSEDEAAYLGGVLFAAATETVAAALCCFILFMAAFPDVQKRAQEELDKHVGPSRMPTLQDTTKLPYLNALMKETLRYRPPAPLAVPHCSTQDFQYEGYIIPRGTTVIGCVWSVHHDQSVYPDPTTFMPERFLTDQKLPHFTFGYGRRACPGSHHAYSSLLVSMAAILWGFDIKPGKDANSKPIAMDVSATAFTDGGEASRPLPFPCIIRARNELVGELAAL